MRATVRTPTIRPRRAPRREAFALALTALSLALVPSTSAAAVDRGDAVATAREYVSDVLRLRPDANQTYQFRSRRDPNWTLVDGFATNDRPWAVFLEREGGAWRVRAGSAQPEAGPADAPCDIRYPFSQPAC